jgi:tripartite-type tricarboxylate transporter receptor subunit TctC
MNSACRAALSVAMIAASLGAQAQYPARPIRLLVPNAPGGGADTTGRALAQGLAVALGKQVVADNRPGAGGNISAEIAAKAPPDGYTLLLGSASHAIGMSLYSKLNFDLRRDFVPISLLVASPYGFTINAAIPATTLTEFIAVAKARTAQFTYASSGSGTFLGGALLFDMSGVKLVNVAYKGGAPALVALMAGEVEVSLTSLAATLPHAKSGKLRVLAVSAAKRSPAAPDLPTVAEAGVPGFEATSWYGLMAPAGTHADVIARLLAESLKLIRSAEMRERLIASGIDPLGTSPGEFGAYVRSEVDKWAKVAKATGSKVE